MIRLSEVAEEGVKLPFHPIVFGIGMFSLLAIALFIVTRLDSDR
jgi:tetrahydromethanopterin S-methyltransferase subunit B